MPEHFNALIWPTAGANPSRTMPKLEDRAALFMLKNLPEDLGYAWRRKIIAEGRMHPDKKKV